MTLLTDFALLCPGVLMLVWGLVFLTKCNKNTSEQIMSTLLILCGIHFIADAFYLFGNISPSATAWINLVRQITAPMLLPMGVVCFRAMSGLRPLSIGFAVWLALVVALGVMVFLMTILVGPHQMGLFLQHIVAGKGISIFNQPLFDYVYDICICYYYVILLAETIYALCGAWMAYFRNPFGWRDMLDVWRGKSAKILDLAIPIGVGLTLICMMRRSLGYDYLSQHPIVSATLSFSMAIMAQIVCFALNRKNSDIYETLLDEHETPYFPIDTIGEENPEINSAILQKLAHEFDHKINNEQFFLQPNISLETAASLLHTNRTYISYLTHHKYNMNFRELINRKRIDYAKTYLRNHPDALIEYVAAQCGYLSTSAFSKNFVLYVGIPPRLWTKNSLLNDKNLRDKLTTSHHE